MKKKLAIILLCVLMAVSFAACGDTSSETIPVSFADAGWDSIQFHNAVAIFIGETAYNIEGIQTSGSTAVTYTGMISGDVDVYMETWTDNIATYDDDLAEDKFQELSLNFGDDEQGLYVPRYVVEGDASRGIEAIAPDLVTVEDLKNYADVFQDPDDDTKGRIYGAPSGWAIDDVMRNKYEYYGLDEMYNYTDPGSDSALAAAISSAYEKGEAIVGYYWSPTWITGKYDLILLEDAPYIDNENFLAGKTECPPVPCTVCVSNAFAERAPEYCEFLSNYETSAALTDEAIGYLRNNDVSMEETAKWFLTEHDELIDEWLPSDKAELVREALSE